MPKRIKVMRSKKLHSEPLSVEAELLWLSESAKDRLLANKIFNWLIRFFHLKDTPTSVLFIAFIVSLLFLSVKLLISKYFYNSEPQYLLGSILASFLISFSFAAVKILHDIILPPNAGKMLYLIEKKGIPLLKEWFTSFLSLRNQLSFSIFIGILAIITIYFVDSHTTAKFDFGDYILGSLAMFGVSHGGYCGLLIPTIAKPLSKGGLKLFWINPSDSEAIKIASWGFRLLTLADGFFVTACIVALYWFRPWESILVASISGIWLIVGVISVSYSFFYPHYYLNLAIRNQKEKQVEAIRKILDVYYDRIHILVEKDFKKLNEYILIYERLLKTRESSINTPALQNYFTSIVIPTLSFLTGLIDLNAIFKTIFKLP
ncbi:MAG: hypothetical protein JNM51_05400 [Bacteroidia bacterium]|nr:hypothetical protein [Bacteroidia bacterium]